MPFALVPATVEDAPTLATIQLRAFGPSPWTAVLFPTLFTGGWDAIHESTAKRIAEEMTENPHVRFVKAIDADAPDNTIAAYAKWEVPHEPEETPKNKLDDPLPPEVNAELYREFFGTMVKKRQEIMGHRGPYWYLHVLVVLPEYQRRGLGRQLTLWGLDQADRDGIQAYIEASRFGYKLYKDLGWEDVYTIEMLNGKQKTMCMIRPARQKGDSVAANEVDETEA